MVTAAADVAGRGDARQVQSGHDDEFRRQVGRSLPHPLPLHHDRHDHELLLAPLRRSSSVNLSAGRVMNFFVAILNDFLSAVASSKDLQNRDFEVMDHFIDTVTIIGDISRYRYRHSAGRYQER